MINILLTGAGFTANFGAPLARDIYEKIYNYREIQQNTFLAEMFKEQNNISAANYEKIFQDVIKSQLRIFLNSSPKKLLRRLREKVVSIRHPNVSVASTQYISYHMQFTNCFLLALPCNKNIGRLLTVRSVYETLRNSIFSTS